MAQYKVEFLPSNIGVSGGGTAEAASAIEQRINAWAQQGWVLDQIAQISVIQQPGCGCLAGLFGIKATVIEYNALIFRHD